MKLETSEFKGPTEYCGTQSADGGPVCSSPSANKEPAFRLRMQNLIVILGTNASGKSELGIRLANHLGGEVVSADSRQVYRGLDLGSGKITPAQAGDGKTSPH